jgi:RNA-binding protein
MSLTLTPRHRAQLKAKAHSLEALVHLGKTGLSEEVVRQTDLALAAHELIKVRLVDADRQSRAVMSEALADRTEAGIVQTVGRVLILWRPRPDDA